MATRRQCDGLPYFFTHGYGRNEGKPLGRPKGAKGRHNKMQGKGDLARQLRKEYGVKEACKILGVSKSTFYRSSKNS